jgi:class 3 adenylate cyclase
VPLSRGLDPIYPRRLLDGQQVLSLMNDSAQELVVRLERTAPRADALTAARASTLALFRELFPAAVLSPGQLISVTTVTLLATHLEGGRDLYRELGDARAFAVIHEHFQLLNDRIRQEGGALIKTVDEGLLAAFPQTVAAVRAGLELPAALAQRERTRGVQLRVSIHSGPAMAATLNGQLDYFGTTVRAVEQLLDAIPAGEMILTPAVAADAHVADLLAGRNLTGKILAVAVPGLDAESVPCLVVPRPTLPEPATGRDRTANLGATSAEPVLS